MDGIKDVLGLYIGENESSKYWLGIFNELKARDIKDIIVMCADGLTGIKENIAVAFPNTEYLSLNSVGMMSVTMTICDIQ